MLDFSVDRTALLDGVTLRIADAPALVVGSERADHEHDLVLRHMGLAEAIAHRYSRGSRDPRDIRQVALLGLVKAARRFDPDRGFPFAAFAGPTIAGEIKRYLRDTAWLVRPPRGLQELALTTASAASELEQAMGQEPTPEEIARHLSRDVSDVVEAIAGAHGMYATPLDGFDEGSDAFGQSEDPADKVHRDLELRSAVRQLPMQERVMLYMRFFEGRNQREISVALGISQMQVSRSLAKALRSVRAALEAAQSEVQGAHSA